MGEADIVEGDVVTLTVLLTRTNLNMNEAAGPVHAPWFPDIKFEEWWLFLIDRGSGKELHHEDTHLFTDLSNSGFTFPND